MAGYDYEYGKMFGVIEKHINNTKIIEPEIIEKTSKFIDDLLKGVGFEALTIVLIDQSISFFPTKKLAENFHDKICKEKAMRSELATH